MKLAPLPCQSPDGGQRPRVAHDPFDGREPGRCTVVVVSRLNPVTGLLPGNRQCRLSHVNAQNRPSQRGEVKSILAGPAACIEHRPGESAFDCQTHHGRLRLASIPRRRTVVIRRVPGQSRQPLMAGWLPATVRILGAGSWSLRQPRPPSRNDLAISSSHANPQVLDLLHSGWPCMIGYVRVAKMGVPLMPSTCAPALTGDR